MMPSILREASGSELERVLAAVMPETGCAAAWMEELVWAAYCDATAESLGWVPFDR